MQYLRADSLSDVNTRFFSGLPNMLTVSWFACLAIRKRLFRYAEKPFPCREKGSSAI